MDRVYGSAGGVEGSGFVSKWGFEGPYQGSCYPPILGIEGCSKGFSSLQAASGHMFVVCTFFTYAGIPSLRNKGPECFAGFSALSVNFAHQTSVKFRTN